LVYFIYFFIIEVLFELYYWIYIYVIGYY